MTRKLYEKLNSNCFAVQNDLKSDLGGDIKIAFLGVYPMTVDIIKLVKLKNLLKPIGNRTCKPPPSTRKYV